mgnify:CR=1 FL=1
MNINKTECKLLGSLKVPYDEILGITVTYKAVNCLGIYTNDDKEECYNKKIDENIPCMEKLFESCKRIKFTLFKKTLGYF